MYMWLPRQSPNHQEWNICQLFQCSLPHMISWGENLDCVDRPETTRNAKREKPIMYVCVCVLYMYVHVQTRLWWCTRALFSMYQVCIHVLLQRLVSWKMQCRQRPGTWTKLIRSAPERAAEGLAEWMCMCIVKEVDNGLKCNIAKMYIHVLNIVNCSKGLFTELVAQVVCVTVMYNVYTCIYGIHVQMAVHTCMSTLFLKWWFMNTVLWRKLCRVLVQVITAHSFCLQALLKSKKAKVCI